MYFFQCNYLSFWVTFLLVTKHLNCVLPRISRSHGVMCCVPLCCSLTLLCTNRRSLGECDKTAPWMATYNSAKPALSRKRISRKQKEAYVNFTREKILPKATQTTQLNTSRESFTLSVPATYCCSQK